MCRSPRFPARRLPPLRIPRSLTRCRRPPSPSRAVSCRSPRSRNPFTPSIGRKSAARNRPGDWTKRCWRFPGCTSPTATTSLKISAFRFAASAPAPRSRCAASRSWWTGSPRRCPTARANSRTSSWGKWIASRYCADRFRRCTATRPVASSVSGPNRRRCSPPMKKCDSSPAGSISGRIGPGTSGNPRPAFGWERRPGR